MDSKDFCVFILSNGRADRVETYKTLKKIGYTGPVFIVCDDLDTQLGEYEKKFPGMVQVFDKKKYAAMIDTGTNDPDMRAIVYARNACFDIAKDLGYKHFLELDDDYYGFSYRYLKDGQLKAKQVHKADAIFAAMVRFLDKTPTTTIAFAQAGDFIGGAGNRFYYLGLARKAMNSFFFRTDRRIWFRGKQNEDVTTYTVLGSQGVLFFTFTKLCILQGETQQNAGGMTEAYKESGGYIKPFSTVIYRPDAVKITMMGTKNRRIHHKVLWKYVSPMILNERWKK